MTVPLSILDLSPLVSGGTVRDALRSTLDLAQKAEQFGYRRYWVAEHHLTPGVASSQPALLLGQIAAVTDHIRLGSGALQTGYLTPLAALEQFGLLDALYPGRFDLGLGRSAQRRTTSVSEAPGAAASQAEPPPPAEARVVDGLLIPRHFDFAPLMRSARAALYGKLLKQPNAEALDLDDVVSDIRTLIQARHAEAKPQDPTKAVGGRGMSSEGGAQFRGALGSVGARSKAGVSWLTGLPAASSIARLARASASLLRSRGIQSKVTVANPSTSFAASAASGRRPGFLICQRPDICSTTSLESIRTSTRVAFSSAAARSPAIRPEYSATLLVVVPREAYRSSSTSPVLSSSTTAP